MSLIKKISKFDLALIAIVLAGLFLRARQYALGRSLWLDEAWLSLNIVNRSFAGLFQPLDYEQGAPIGFLLAQKLCVVIFGNHDYVLRLFPFVCGCAALILFAFFVRKVLSPAGAIAALILIALETRLVYYASEAKQYSTDVLAAVIVLWLAAQFIGAKNFDRRGAYRFAIISTMLLWFSHPALFMISGASAAITIYFLLNKNFSAVKHFWFASVMWLAAFALLYLITLRGLAENSFLLRYWSEGFVPRDARLIPAWFWQAFAEMIPLAWGETIRWSLPVMFLIGYGLFWKREAAWAIAITTIITLAVIASALSKYPFWGRMILFLQPIMALGAGESLGLIRDLIPKLFAKQNRITRAVTVIVMLIMLLPHGAKAAENVISPKMQEHIKPTMEYLRDNRAPDDLIYVYHGAIPAFKYYAPFYEIDMRNVVFGVKHADDFSAYRAELDALPNDQRVWVLFSHVFIEAGGNEKDFMFNALKALREKKREFKMPGTSVFLYLFSTRR
jgi:hypothetical protein